MSKPSQPSCAVPSSSSPQQPADLASIAAMLQEAAQALLCFNNVRETPATLDEEKPSVEGNGGSIENDDEEGEEDDELRMI